MVIICIKYDGLESPILTTSFVEIGPTVPEDFKKVFNIYVRMAILVM